MDGYTQRLSKKFNKVRSVTGGATGNSASVKRGTGSTEDKRNRPEAKELERIYRSMPIAWRAVNTLTQLELSKPFTIEEDVDSREYIESFMRGVGEVAGDNTWEEIVEIAFRYPKIYGAAYFEKIYDKNSGNIVDVVSINPKTIDYAKNRNDEILMDEKGNAVGYVQTLEGHFLDSINKVYEPPEEVHLNHNQIYLPQEAVIEIPYYAYGDGFYPVGLLEVAYTASERNYTLQDDFADKAHAALFPTRYALVGDDIHEPTPDKIQEVHTGLKNANSSTEIAMPYYTELGVLEPENPDALIDFLDYFDDEIIRATGIPKAFATGSGENVNRATLRAQARVLDVRIKYNLGRTLRQFEEELFKPLAKQAGFEEYPEYDVDMPETDSLIPDDAQDRQQDTTPDSGETTEAY